MKDTETPADARQALRSHYHDAATALLDAVLEHAVGPAVDDREAYHDDHAALVELLADADEAGQERAAGRWQEAIRDHLLDHLGKEHAGAIDGGCCDGGPLKVTLTEITQALNIATEGVPPTPPWLCNAPE